MGCFQSKTRKDSAIEEAERAKLAADVLTRCKSSVVEVPCSELELHYCSLSLEGFQTDKPNQDSVCIQPQLGGDPNDHLFGVFDGHGPLGGKCSWFVKENIGPTLLRTPDFKSDTFKAFNTAFETSNEQLHDNLYLDDSMSGTTAVTVLVRGDKLHVANVGDSRAILAEKSGKTLVALDLSNDQTPYREDELQRVKSHGGVVMTLGQVEGGKNPDVKCWGRRDDDGSDPPRVWVFVPRSGEYRVGSAFTRSIGDKYGETYAGVIAEPEVTAVQLTPNHPFFVVVSDGVTQFLSSQEIVDTIAKYEDIQQACSTIVARSYFSWLENEGYSDDITVIIVQIKGLNDVPERKPSSHSKGTLNWRKLCTPAQVHPFYDLE